MTYPPNDPYHQRPVPPQGQQPASPYGSQPSYGPPGTPPVGQPPSGAVWGPGQQPGGYAPQQPAQGVGQQQPYGLPGQNPPQPGPSPYGSGTSHLGQGGALQPGGYVPGGQRPGPYGQGGQRPYPMAPQGRYPGAPQGPTGSRTTPVVVAVIAGVLVLAVVAGAALWLGRGSRTPTTTPTPSRSAGTAKPGQTVSKPPVPQPTATTKRSYDSPDRPQVQVPDVKPPGFVDAPAGSGLDRYTKQKIAWASCTVGKATVECGTVAVPLDYTKPDGQAITLKLARVKASVEPKLGTIFINPGGPGGAGTSLVPSFQRTGLEMYDIVGWDPRGTGGSTPVVCGTGPETDAFMQLDQSPDDEAEKQALLDGTKAFGMACLAKSGPLLEHITTLDTVADLDTLRQIVGDKELNFFGYSYGTYIGSVYAEKYPKNVGKLVLDAAVNITEDESVVQASGFDLALGNYAAYCASKGCPLGSTKEEVMKTVTDLLDKLDSQPATGSGDRKLTQSLALDGIAMFLYYDETYWSTLTTAIDQARKGNGARLLQYADAMRERNPDGTYDTGFYAFPAIGCADSRDDGIGRAMSDWALDQKKAPIFGKYFGPGFTCVQWPVKGTAPFDIKGAGAKPIVVVGATGDSATPYQFAAWMADKLESGVLVTYDGFGHGTYGNDKSTCVDDMVVAYFAKGEVPPDGLYCKK